MAKCKENRLCFNCDKAGHLSKECPTCKAKTTGGGKGNKVSDPNSKPLINIAKVDVLTLEAGVPLAREERPSKPIFVEVSTNKVKGLAMVDTGATSNFISEAMAKRVNYHTEEMLEPLVCKFANDTQGLVSKRVNHAKLEVLGEGGSYVSSENFYVLQGLEVDFILSVGYLRKHNVNLFPGQEMLTLPGKGGKPFVIREFKSNKDESLNVSKVSWTTSCISAKQWSKDVKGGFENFYLFFILLLSLRSLISCLR